MAMTDKEIIAAASVEIDKVRKWRESRRGKPNRVEYVLLPLSVAERLLTLAAVHLAEGGNPEP